MTTDNKEAPPQEKPAAPMAGTPTGQQMKITPAAALNFIQKATDDYRGTKADHQALDHSMLLIRTIVSKWIAEQQAAQGPASPNRKQRRAGQQKARKAANKAARAAQATKKAPAKKKAPSRKSKASTNGASARA